MALVDRLLDDGNAMDQEASVGDGSPFTFTI